MSRKYTIFALFIVVIFLSLIAPSTAQGTISYSDERCEAYAGGICEGIIPIGAPIYLRGGDNQADLTTKKIMSYQYLFAIASEVSGCNRILLSTLCANAFPSCGYDLQNQIVRIDPCPQLCSDLITYCPLMAPFLKSYGSPVTPSDYADTNTNIIPIFPQCAPKNVRCENRFEFEFIPENIVTPVPACPPPLVNAVEGYESILDGTCAIPCPNLSYTTDEYEKEDIVIIFFNVLSLVLMLFLFISWSLFPALRLKSYVYYYFFCILMVTASLFVLIPIAGSRTIASSLCENPVQEYHMKGYSLFQGLVVSYFYIAGIAWSMMLSFDIFLSVVLGKHFARNAPETRYKEIGYHIFSWGMGFYSIIGGLASEQIGATLGVGGAYSLITPSRTQIKEGEFDAGDPFFYFPLLIMTCISALLMIATLIKLAKFKFDTNTLSGLKKATFIRLFLFIIANTFIICVFIVYKLYVVDQREATEEAAKKFAYCLLFRGHILERDCGARPTVAPDFNVLLLTVALMNGMGVIAFLIYGTTANLYLSYLGYLHVRWKLSIFKGYSEYYHSSQHSSLHNSSKTNSRTGSNTTTTTTLTHTQTAGSVPGHSQTMDDHSAMQHHHASSHERQPKTVFDYANRKNRKYTNLEMTTISRQSSNTGSSGAMPRKQMSSTTGSAMAGGSMNNSSYHSENASSTSANGPDAQFSPSYTSKALNDGMGPSSSVAGSELELMPAGRRNVDTSLNNIYQDDVLDNPHYDEYDEEDEYSSDD